MRIFRLELNEANGAVLNSIFSVPLTKLLVPDSNYVGLKSNKRLKNSLNIKDLVN